MDHFPASFTAARDACLSRLRELVNSDPRLVALWLQGSLAVGTADPMSDIDAYIAVADEAIDEVFGERLSLLGRVGTPLAWSNATAPGLKAVHALLDGPVKIDLFFEPASTVGNQPRPTFSVLVDKGGIAGRLRTGWEPPRAVIAGTIDVVIRMTRQGALWPLRLLFRGQWSTLAMMELDLINGQVAQLMAVQLDPAHFYQNPFALSRLLRDEQRAELDALASAALQACGSRDVTALREVHLRVFDALVREGRAACAALGVAYPITAEADAAIRAVLAREWPAA